MALSIHTAIELSKLPFIDEVTALKKQVDAIRPLPKDLEQKILQKFRLEWNYNSNAIEGNQLTYGETVAFILEGVTAKGKTLKDHLDIKGHDEAIKYLLDLVKDKAYELNEAEIRNLHKLILKENYEVDAETPDGKPTKRLIEIGQYKTMPNHVRTATGEIHYYASVEEAPAKMGDLMAWYKEAKASTEVHPVVLATLFHHEFTSIHPFDDGNGRMARLLMNLMLLQDGYTPIVVKQKDKSAYYQVLRQADAGEMIPIAEYMSQLASDSLTIYLKGARGEKIEEEDDIDKEIELFKKSLANDVLHFKRDESLIEKVVKENVFPFFDYLFLKLKKLNDLFIDVKRKIIVKGIEYKNEEDINEFGLNDYDEYFFKINNPVLRSYNSEVPYSSYDYNINYIQITIDFEGFKKNKNPTSIFRSYKTHFSEFQYHVTRQPRSEKIIEDIYGQALKKEKILKIVKHEVDFLMQEIQQYLNEQEK